MSTKIARVAVSLPRETLEIVERLRREQGLARSAVFLEGVRLWIREKEERELEEKYVKGYQKKPERVQDVEPLYRAGLSSFTPEGW